EAVLVRALSVREGVARIQARRPDLPLEKQANGPGKLCIALEIGRAQNALDLTASGELWIEDHGTNPNISVVAGPRIGIGDRHDAVHWPLRFGVRDHPALSPPRFES
ncbi:MAG TPA: DNA-3-methyladenine glycosylase, partial [Bdellovibrionales bacterium]|nr:DNA-3-methyladenine glycosylase [Bdellovibrionales bacterium]